ncbi:MAG: helix-turn-helix transcriptional regulator [Acidobacteria bacterium]|nr:helix-turn-helix transcriptional regulator [Acidobacteriota bacterium]
MSDLTTRIGERLRALRLERGLTQEQLGERADLSYKFIGEVERGDANPTVGTLDMLATALGVTIAEFFDKAAEKSAPAAGFALTSKDVQVVREAVRSLEHLLDHVEETDYRRPRRRGQASKR